MQQALASLAGPLGQCHPIPDDPQLKAEMLKHARNYTRIHRMYNLPYQSEPGSDMAKVGSYPPVMCQPFFFLDACVYQRSITAVSHYKICGNHERPNLRVSSSPVLII